MDFSQIRTYVKGLIKASFPNKTTLDKFTITSDDRILYNEKLLALDSVEDIKAIEVTTMPAMSINIYGKVYKYLGATNDYFTNGKYYRCERFINPDQVIKVAASYGSSSTTHHYAYLLNDTRGTKGTRYYSDEDCFFYLGYFRDNANLSAPGCDIDGNVYWYNFKGGGEKPVILNKKYRYKWVEYNYNTQYIQVEDGVISTINTWSSNKINTEINARVGIDDLNIVTNKTWSSNKINAELDTINTSLSTVVSDALPNKTSLDKIGEDSDGNFTYSGNILKTKISSDTNNAIKENADGIFVEDLNEKINKLNYAQKTVNENLDSCYCDLAGNHTPVVGQYIPIVKKSGNMAVQNGLITVKPKQRVEISLAISAGLGNSKEFININFGIIDVTNNIVIAAMNPIDIAGYEFAKTCISQYTNETDTECQIGIKPSIITSNSVLVGVNVTVKEIGRAIVVDPIEHVNTTNGLEDTPVGHIMSYMGATPPKHYLTCDGSTYNIVDYPYLAEFIKKEFGAYEHFGGDGINTFAVPDLRGEFLRGTGTNGHANQGSGSGVGEHQDATEHLYVRADGGSVWASNFRYEQQKHDSIVYDGKINNGSGGGNFGGYPAYYTSRPTNTSVLYCIKYEPTYYMQISGEAKYSENETIIGSWLGKPLYRKVFTSIIPDNTGLINIPHNIKNIETVSKFYGYITRDENYFQFNYCQWSPNAATAILNYANSEKIEIYLSGKYYANCPAVYILEYTKTTDPENSFSSDMITGSSSGATLTDDDIDAAVQADTF